METVLRSQSLGERWATQSFSQKSAFQPFPHVFSILMSGKLDPVRSTFANLSYGYGKRRLKVQLTIFTATHARHRAQSYFLSQRQSSSRAVPSIERWAAPIECDLSGHFVFENNRTDRPETRTSAVPALDTKMHSCLEKTSEPNSWCSWYRIPDPDIVSFLMLYWLHIILKVLKCDPSIRLATNTLPAIWGPHSDDTYLIYCIQISSQWLSWTLHIIVL